jgi:integrase
VSGTFRDSFGAGAILQYNRRTAGRQPRVSLFEEAVMKERNLKQIDGKWYVDFTYRGKRIRQFAGYTKDQARNTLAKLRIDRLDERLGFKKPGQGEAVPFEKFADDFIELYSKPGKRSWKNDEFLLNTLKNFFKGETLQTITAEKIERFKVVRKGEVSPATVNRAISCLKTLLNKAVEWGKLPASPAVRIKKFREPPGRERILSPEEARRLLDVASPEFQPILIAALGTGMRRGEILALRWTDLDFARGIITITNSKSGRSRKIPMSGTVAATLGTVPHRGEYVFWNSETKTHIKDTKTAWAAACARAKVAAVRFHDCRHTALTWMLQSGADIVSVSKIAGHASIVMTQRYCHASPELQRLAVNKVGEILGPTRQNLDTHSGTVIEVPPVCILGRDN